MESHRIETRTEARIFKGRQVEKATAQAVRVYKSTPDNITVQIWSYGPMNGPGAPGINREASATAHMTKAQVHRLIEALQAELMKF